MHRSGWTNLDESVPYENNASNWKRITEWIGIVAALYYVCVAYYDSSRFMFSFLGISRIISVAMPMICVGGLRFLSCAIGEWKKNRTKLLVKMGAYAIFLLICAYLTVSFDYVNFAYLSCAMLCLYSTDTDKVLKSFCAVLSFLLAGTILCSLTGAVQNLISASIGVDHLGNLRSAFGIASATDFAAYFVFLLAFFWASREEKRDIWNTFLTIGLVILAAWGIYKYTSTWTSILLCCLLVLLMIYEFLERKVFLRKKYTLWIPKATGFLAVTAFPVLGISYCILTWLYSRGNVFALRLDALIDSRLKLTWASIQQYGIHPMGALTPQHGWGGNVIHNWQGSYDFLDAGYGLLIVRYGWVIAAIIAVIWVLMTIRALKKGHRRLAFVMALIAVHTFEEHHFPELNYNILLAMPFCHLSVFPKEEDTEATRENRNDNLLSRLPWEVGITLAIPCFFLMPVFISRTRTVFAIKNWTGGENQSLFSMLFFLAVIGLLVLLWASVKRFIQYILSGDRDNGCWKAAVGIFLSVSLFVAGALWISHVIATGSERYERRLQADKKALGIILNAAEQPVYVAQIGTIYRKEFSALSETLGSPESISGEKRGTMLLERNEESFVFSVTGARYAEISPYSSIYTYDDAVVSALQSAGYIVRGYYYTEKEVDLGTNNLLLEEAFVNKTDISLYGNTYITTFDLSLDPNILQGVDGIVCTLEVTTYHGDNLIIKKNLLASDFQKDGKVKESLTYNIGNSAGVEFNIYPNVPVILHRISYKQNPASDIWRTYNKYNQVVKIRYFSADGKPLPQSEGQYGFSYEYEKGTGLAILGQFLDADGNIMTSISQYAQIRWEYNDKKQTESIHYLDIEGNPCINSRNYSIERREYDDLGRITDFSYYDIDYKPVRMLSGYSKLHRIYNEKNQGIKDVYLDEYGDPIALSAGQAAEEYGYDEFGNLILTRRLGINGEPVLSSSGWAEVRRVFDEQGHIVEESYYGVEGTPVLLPAGYATVKRGYDKEGNVNFEKYYGLNREPIRLSSGYGELHRTFKDKHVVRDDYYDIDGTPIAIDAGYFGVKYEYDEAGNINRYMYIGENGNLIMRSDGFAELRVMFNEKRQKIRQEFYDSEGNPVKCSDGFFAVEYIYKEDGSVEEKYFDIE